MLYKKFIFFIVSSSLLLSGCGGGGLSDVKEDVYYSLPITPSPTTTTEFPYGAYNNYDLIKAGTFRDPGFDGTGVTVAVLDTGLETPSNADFNVLDLQNKTYQYDSDNDQFIPTGDTYLYDDSPHGKHMSEIIGSSNVGIAPGVSILEGVISFNTGYTDMYNQEFGAQWASENGADFINISFSYGSLFYPKALGNSNSDDQLYYALKTIDDNSSVIVHSLGNDSSDVDVPIDGGSYADITLIQPDNILYVGAIDNNGVLSSFSNKPGEGNTAIIDRTILAPGASQVTDGTSYGTSGAAANVTGALALMKQRWTQTPPTELAQLLLDTANKEIPNYDPAVHGQGVLDMYRATQPYGTATVSTSSISSLPMKALNVSLPEGFKATSYNQTFLDSLGRDFSSKFTTGITPYRSRFTNEFSYFGVKPKPRKVSLNQSLTIGFFEKNNRFQSDENIESNLIQMNNLDSQMFIEPREIQGFTLSSKGYSLSFSSNINDKASGTQTAINSETGFKTSLSVKGLLKIDYYQSSYKKDDLGVFYGADKRNFQGLRMSIGSKSLFGGMEYSSEKYQGTNSIFSDMAIKGQSLFFGTSNSFKAFDFGLMGRLEHKDLSLSAELTRGDGTGNIYYQKANIKSDQNLASIGAYLNGKNFNSSIFKNDFDQGIVFKMKKEF